MRWLIFLLTSLMIFSSSACSRTGVSGLTALPDPLFDHDADGIPNECDSDFNPDLTDSDSDGVIDECEINLTGEWTFLATVVSENDDSCPSGWGWLPNGTEWINVLFINHTEDTLEIGDGWEISLSSNPNGSFNEILTITRNTTYSDGITLTRVMTLTILDCDNMSGNSISTLSDGLTSCSATSSWTVTRMGACDGELSGSHSDNEQVYCDDSNAFLPDLDCLFYSSVPVNFIGDVNHIKVQVTYWAVENNDYLFNLFIPSVGWVLLEDAAYFGTRPDASSIFFVEYEVPISIVSSITNPNDLWTLEACDLTSDPTGGIYNWCLILE